MVKVDDLIPRGRDGSPSRLVAGGGLLVLLAFLLFLGVVGVLASLDQRTKANSAFAREMGVWAGYQLDTEAQNLTHILELEEAVPGKYTVKQIELAYDLLYSRVGVLIHGAYPIRYDDETELGSLVRATTDEITGLAGDFDSFKDAKQAPPALMSKLARKLEDLGKQTHDITIQTSQRLTDIKAQDRVDIAHIYMLSLGGVILIMIAMLAVITILFVQLTQLNKSRKELALAAAAAEEGNRAKSAFLATISHEIRTPLNGMLGMIDLLDDDNLDPSKARKVATAKRSGEALVEIISDILNFSKLEHGEDAGLETKAFRLSRVVDVVTELVGSKAKSKGLRVITDFPNIMLRADPARLRQVLFNLLGNAVKFTTTGEVGLKIAVLSREGSSESWLRCEISDTGMGIPKEGMPGLFREFYRVHDVNKSKEAGTGLGLAISKRLVTRMGGTIDAKSIYGVGSTFWFEIPVSGVETAPPEETTATPRKHAVIHGHALVAEDNEVNQEVAQEMLERIGLTVDLAEDGDVALQKIRSQTYDLIFMDVQMPNIDGLSATRMIRQAGIKTTIVGLTGNAYDSDRIACLDAGMNDFIAKPFNRTQLEECIVRWMMEKKMVVEA